MGSLYRFDLASIVAKYGLKVFVETGTAREIEPLLPTGEA